MPIITSITTHPTTTFACRLTHNNKEPATLVPTDLTRAAQHEWQCVHRRMFELVQTFQLQHLVSITPHRENFIIYYRMSNRQNSVRS